MSSGSTIKKKTPKGTFERLADLEQSLPQVISAINQGFVQYDQRLAGMVQLHEALIEIIGAEKVREVVSRREAEAAAARAETARLNLEKAVEQGTLSLTDVIQADSLVVGIEYDKDGVVMGAGRTQLPMSSIRPDIREQLLGKGAGFRLEIENGLFEVLEAYMEIPAPVVLPGATTQAGV